ncbi:protein mono-ADP-ribosyltransferase PARP15-like isoform X2 [Glandiceps talaboti]
MSFKTPEGKVIKLIKGDLSKEKVDVIVNTTGDACNLTEGVVSTSVQTVAGKALQEEIDEKKPSSITAGLVIVTSGANLSCKHVYHVCILGTRWDGGKTVEPLLRKVVQTCFQNAHQSGMTSISIPAIGTGQLNYPRDIVAKVFYEEAISFSSKNPGSSLNDIRVVVYDKDTKTSTSFEEEMKRFQGTSTTSLGSTTSLKEEESSVSGKYNTAEGKIVELVKGNIVDEKTDVIVNAIQASSSWNYGAISSAIVSSGGQAIIDEFNKVSKGDELKGSDVVVTSPGNMKCGYVYHVCVMGTDWDGDGANCEQVFRNGVKNCLEKADQNKITSIAIPAMCTGGHSYPLASAAKFLFEEIIKFSANNPSSSVDHIRIVVYHQNTNVSTVFDQEMTKMFSTPDGSLFASHSENPKKLILGVGGKKQSSPHTSTKEKKTSRTRLSEESAHTPRRNDRNTYKMAGKTIKLRKGNIINEKSNVVINAIRASAPCFYGAISSVIVGAAGGTLSSDFDSKKPAQLNDGDVVITEAGNLKCQNVYHVCVMGTDWDSSTSTKCEQVFRSGIRKCLETADQNKMKSISIPPMCTGGHKYPLHSVAKFMFEEINKFSTSKPTSSVKEIRIVVYDESTGVFKAFESEVQKFSKTGSPQLKTPSVSAVSEKEEGFFSSTSNGVIVKLIRGNIVDQQTTAIVNAIQASSTSWNYGVISGSIVGAAGQTLVEDFKSKNPGTLTQGSVVKTLPGNLKCQHVYHVCVMGTDWEKSTNCEQVFRTAIKTCLETAEQDQIDSISIPAMCTGGHGFPLDSAARFMFEEVINYSERKPNSHIREIHIIVYDKNTSVCEAFEEEMKKMAFYKDQLMSSVYDTKQLPTNWSPMAPKERCKSVPLDSQSPEYQDVVKRFQATCPNTIVKIERIQNPALYYKYDISKQDMVIKNPTEQQNEQLLYHGTKEETIEKINSHGFNRSFAGDVAGARFGKGVYFAKTALFSSGYTHIDKNGNCHMYQARVLTGVYTTGNSSLKEPPAIDKSKPTDLYDSVVDNERNPEQFVVFNDAVAYPEYHIILK